jgi:predicted Zn-dependent protease
MPGNRAIYDRAMDQSREASQQARWDDALKSAVRALNEFPQDVEARILAAVALFNTGKSSQSLQIFEELRAAEPNNPFYHEYIARNHERAGNTRAAVQSYIDMAALHTDRKMTAKVVESLRAVLRLQPDNDEQRLRLAGLLEETGAGAAAGTEYFILAQHAQAQASLILLPNTPKKLCATTPTAAKPKNS